MEGSRRRGDELPRGDDPEVVARYESAVDLVALAVRQITAGGRLQGERSELEAWGREGLLDAARRFDPSRGIGFRTFAYYRVRGAILDGLRKMGTWSRRGYERVLLLRAAQSTSEGAYEDYLAARGDLSAERAEQLLRDHMAAMATAMTMGLFAAGAEDADGVVAVARRDDPEAAYASAELESLLRSSVDELPPPEDEIIRRHYFDGESLEKVGGSLGLSKSWASRLHTRAIRRLTLRLRQLPTGELCSTPGRSAGRTTGRGGR
ncbi:MAG: sigma-70 family RNA polymerase sigma factor [Myxococcales bacterium]|nr:sigma-70 family RNA polymerase sigma factor [Myxococcales bacterium]